MFSPASFVTVETDLNTDANSLLSELDKGLRSVKIGEQCEAIVRFPSLFERYPFPILINSACLKLAEVFRNGTNFLRVLILKVMQQSEKHLDKIVNVDEFVRRLFAVTFSNDPLARAITLRIFASIARIVAHRRNLHHYIRNSLDALDEHELDAGIEATVSFAKNSKEFASNIYPKVMAMINRTNISLETKISLLSALHHVNYNTEVSTAIRTNCANFLPNAKSDKFISACLHTLTVVAATSLTQVPHQIELLLDYLNRSTDSVKLSVLRDLQFLAKSSPHLWLKDNINLLVDSASALVEQQAFQDAFLSHILFVLTTLVKSPCILAGQPDCLNEVRSKIAKFCLRIIYNEHNNVFLVGIVMNILTNLSLNEQVNSQTMTDIVQETFCAMQSFLFLSVDNFSAKKSLNIDDRILKKIFICVTSLCQSFACDFITGQIVESLGFIVINTPNSSNWFGFACESLCSIGSSFVSERDIFTIIESFDSTKDCNESNLTKIYTLYFQVTIFTKIDDSKANILLTRLENTSLWCCFKVIRQAMRYGHYSCASHFLEKLKYKELIENINFWVNSLSCISDGENWLFNIQDKEQTVQKNLNIAISKYIQGLTNLKASVTPNNQFKFQCEYVKLRLRYLKTHQLFNDCCKLIQTNPAPAIAASAALITRDDLLKCGNIVVMMRKSAKEFRLLADLYSNLYQSSFNADSNSLAHIQLLQHSCVILAEAIENLVQSNRINSFFISKENPFQGNSNVSSFRAPLEHQKLIETCSKISKTLTEITFQNQQMQDIFGAKHIRLLQNVSMDLLKSPLCIPRFFFQSIQNTCITLNISPQPKTPDNILIINSNINFALHVEGIIKNSGNKTLREVNKILLTVTTNLISRTGLFNNNEMLTKPNQTGDLSLQTVVVPCNDYFQSQFLLSLTNPGNHTINIDTSIIDKNEAQWKSGPHITLSAKVIEDSTCK